MGGLPRQHGWWGAVGGGWGGRAVGARGMPLHPASFCRQSRDPSPAHPPPPTCQAEHRPPRVHQLIRVQVHQPVLPLLARQAQGLGHAVGWSREGGGGMAPGRRPPRTPCMTPALTPRPPPSCWPDPPTHVPCLTISS